MEEFPKDFENIIHFKVDFKELIKILNLLRNYQTEINGELANLKEKILSLDVMEKNISELQIKSKLIENNQKDLENTLTNHQQKILGIDSRFKNLEDAEEESKVKMDLIETKIINNEVKMNEVNKQIEDHLKESKGYLSQIEQNAAAISQQNMKSEKLEMDMKDLEKSVNEKFIEVETKSKEIYNEIEEGKAEMNSKYNTLEKTVTRLISKTSDYDRMLNNIGDNMLSRKGSIKNISAPGSTTAESVDFESLRNELTVHMEKSQNDYDKFNVKIQNLDNAMDRVNSTIQQLKDAQNEIRCQLDTNMLESSMKLNTSTVVKTEDEEEKKKKSKKEESIGLDKVKSMIKKECNEILNGSDVIKRLSDTLNVIKGNLGNYVDKTELKTELSNLTKKMNQIGDKSENYYNNYDSRLKKLKSVLESSMSNQSSNFDYSTLMRNIETQINETVKSKGKELFIEELRNLDINMEIPFLVNIKNLLDGQKSNLDATNASIEALNEIYVTKDSMNETKEEQEEKNMNYSRDIKVIKEEVTKLKSNLEVAGDEDGEKKDDDEEGETMTLGKRMQILQLQINSTKDKLEENTEKIQSVTKEILNNLNSLLKKEIDPITKKFQKSLDLYINQIRDSLNGKVDSHKFNSFSMDLQKHLDSKLKNKLERSELDKNTHKINRTIGSLENKISKTLVDTIIDLEMSEAPLIVKKGVKAERCASCNQILPSAQSTFYSTSTGFRNTKYTLKGGVKESGGLPEIKEVK